MRCSYEGIRTLATALSLVLACSCGRGNPSPGDAGGPPDAGSPPGPADAGARDGSLSADASLESTAVLQDCTLAPLPAVADVNYALNREYNQVAGQSLQLDVAWPKTPGPHPLVVTIHGGGWRSGDRLGFREVVAWLAGQGYAAATLDYRLINQPQAGDNLFPAAVQDVRCALRWLRAHAAEFSIDPTRVVALGGSAGGHLSSMLGVASDVAGLDGACATSGQELRVLATVSLAGPQDLRKSSGFDASNLYLVTDFLGCAPEDCPAKASLASPQAHVNAGDPPFLLLHGQADALVPISQSRGMHAALHQAGVRATLVEVPGLGHEEIDFWAPVPAARSASCTLAAFLRQVLQP